VPVLARLGLPLLAHAELDAKQARVTHDDPRSYAGYLESRPRAWENDAIDLLIRLCGEFKCHTHIVHLSSSDAIKAIIRARTDGLPLTVETCPHYLYFAAERIPDGDTRFKCAPPIREEKNREMLWGALKAGVIDFIVSDHSPCPPAMKLLGEGDFRKAWGGIASLQFGLPIVWTETRKFECSIEDVARWMCSGPAKFLGLAGRKGAIAAGHDADLIIWNPEVPFRVQRGGIYHRHKVTPYEGETLYGLIEKTYLRGRLVSEQGVVLAGATGQIIRREPTGK
jgi:allantoinase